MFEVSSKRFKWGGGEMSETQNKGLWGGGRGGGMKYGKKQKTYT